MSDLQLTPISILFVDPDIEDRAYWVRRLELASPEYVITTVEEGRTAIEMCRSRRFDCVVLELKLPDISGFEVLTHLCPVASQPDVAVVILTKLLFTTLSAAARTNGAQSYLIKPQTSGDQLDTAIQKAVARVGPTSKRLPTQAMLNDRESLRGGAESETIDG
ncbi:protein of unknown function [Nitrospira japonica]|uniref:Response regulatory domain-containing protein n=1 Tax=Nitrospira japonica TaxID=1325564 RepID=A0A1W1I513_9BACT|nr:response regulator [Nitrospira japonica]SLM48108.1 protein of unknown function [Nitrospira japonica]